ncbi:coiled-coil domain-containing protein 66-like [Cololabis saira]|uniref:coiled-coil domain-containing protein 66-like n=1 Tax=Cololabis saira TaxID=129043 RepID=UPI002AD49204|nr:coiled-coil domain-containing protein 66-like [Cololabis saira]
MNLGDGLLFELENGKPRLILLSHGKERNQPKQPSVRSRAANVLGSRQPSCLEDVRGVERPLQQLAGKHREAKLKTGGAAPSSTSITTATEERSTVLAPSKSLQEGSVKAVAKVKSNKHKLCTTLGPLKVNGRAGQPPKSGTRGGAKTAVKDEPSSGDREVKQRVVCLTGDQLQQILSSVQTSRNGLHPAEDQGPQGGGNQTDHNNICSVNGEEKEEDGKGDEGMKNGEGREAVTTRSSAEKDSRLSGCFFSWLEERQPDSRAAITARKAQWKRELDEQVAQKHQQQHHHHHHQCSLPDRLQGGEKAESVLSCQSSVSHREQPAAIRSSLRLGEVTPMEEALTAKSKEEQRRRWLEELDRQREETAERRKREKLLQSRTEDHERWAKHLDSLQRRPPVPAAAPSALPPVQLAGSDPGELEPWSSLSLVWDATSSCGAESIVGASVDSAGGYPIKSSYLRTMTSLLDPVQIEERERRRLKQLEQQRAIEAQMEEGRKRRQQEEAKRRRQEEEDERRVAMERETLQRQYELEVLKRSQKQQFVLQDKQPEQSPRDSGQREDSSTPRQLEGSEDAGRSSLYKHTAVQTETTPPPPPLRADVVQTTDVAVRSPTPPSQPAAPPASRSRAARAGKENICVPAGADVYEPFARTERSGREKRRPEWNKQRPSHQFVPASERYPVVQQKSRQESRLKRQSELLALQDRTRLARGEETRLCPDSLKTRTSPSRKVGTGFTTITADRGRSPPVPAERTPAQRQRGSSPPPAREFVPYVRTDEVFRLEPLDPAEAALLHRPAAPPQSSASPLRQHLLHPLLPRSRPAQRQQEILSRLAELRQSLLQKQRELETEPNPPLKGHEPQPPSAAHAATSTSQH